MSFKYFDISFTWKAEKTDWSVFCSGMYLFLDPTWLLIQAIAATCIFLSLLLLLVCQTVPYTHSEPAVQCWMGPRGASVRTDGRLGKWDKVLQKLCLECACACLRKNLEKSAKSPLSSLLIQQHTPPPRNHKWKLSFVWGEWSRFTVDGLPTKDHTTVTTRPGSAAPTFTQYDFLSQRCRFNFCGHPAFTYLQCKTMTGHCSIFLNTDIAKII